MDRLSSLIRKQTGLGQGLEFYVGDCPTGLDIMLRRLVAQAGYEPHVYYAKWGQFGRKGRGDPAGNIRNREMVDTALAAMAPGDTISLHAFHQAPLSSSKGTKDCAKYGVSKGIPSYYTDEHGNVERLNGESSQGVLRFSE